MCSWVFLGIFTMQYGGGCVLWGGVEGHFLVLVVVVKLCFRFDIISFPQNRFFVSFQKCCFGIINCGKF